MPITRKKILLTICLTAVLGCSSTTDSFDKPESPQSSFRPSSEPVVYADLDAEGKISSADREGRFYACREKEGCKVQFRKAVELIRCDITRGRKFILERDGKIGPISLVSMDANWKQIYKFTSTPGEEIYGFDVYKDEKIAIARGESMCADLVNYDDGKLLYRLCVDQEYGGAVITSLKFNPQGDKLALGHFRGRVYIWDVKQKKVVKRIDLPEDGTKIAERSVKEILFSPDGKMMFVGTESAAYESAITLFSVGDGKVHAQSTELQGVHEMKISPDGKSVAAIELRWKKKRVLLLDANTLKVKQVIAQEEAEKFFFTRLNFSPDGKRLVVGDSTGEIRIYEIGSK